MSRALLRSARRPLDAYYTPRAVADACVDIVQPYIRGPVLEPSVGAGAWLRSLRRPCIDWMPARPKLWACDVDANAPGLELANDAWTCDFLAWEPPRNPGRPDILDRPEWVLGNPPYCDAEAHVRHALSVTSRHVAMLLRVGFLESQQRAALWESTPLRKVWVLVERPSFEHATHTPDLPQAALFGEEPTQAADSTNGTDSAAYMFAWWDLTWRREPRLGWVSWR